MKAECQSYLNVLCSSSDRSCTKSQAPALGNKGHLVMLDDEAKLVEEGLTPEQVVGSRRQEIHTTLKEEQKLI